MDKVYVIVFERSGAIFPYFFLSAEEARKHVETFLENDICYIVMLEKYV